MSGIHDDSAPADGSASTPEKDLRRQQQQKRSRFFIGFAMIEAAVLAVAVIGIFVLELIDPSYGIWVLLAVLLVMSTALGGYLLISTRSDQRELDELRRRS